MTRRLTTKSSLGENRSLLGLHVQIQQVTGCTFARTIFEKSELLNGF